MTRIIHPVRLAIAPLVVATIAIATAVPLELRPAVWWDGDFDTLDFVENLILYAPLGAALSGRSWRRVPLLAAALSIAAEVIQIWSFERFSSPYDVSANVLGACGGMWLRRRYQPLRSATSVVLHGPAIAGCLLATVLTYALWKVPIESSEIAGWDASFPVVLGNERTGGRPWQGTVSEMRIVAGALSPKARGELEESNSREFGDRGLGASTLYRHSTAIQSDGGSATSLPLSLSEELVERISEAGGFTLMLKIRPADIVQRGPARIVSFSRDTQQRNFDLGQEEDRLTLRVRTPVSGPNGQSFRAETVPVLEPQTEVFVIATYDGAVSRIFVDGRLSGRSNLAAAGCVVSTMCGSALPIVWSFFGATLVLLALAMRRSNDSRRRISLAIAGSACAAVTLPLVPHVFPAWAGSPAWMKAMPLIGALVVGIAAVKASRDRRERDGPDQANSTRAQ